MRPGTPVSLESDRPPSGAHAPGRSIQARGSTGKASWPPTSWESTKPGKRETVPTLRREPVRPGRKRHPPRTDPAIKIGHVTITGERSWEAGRREIWKYLVLAGLAVLLLEWYIYIRRIY